MSPDYTLRVPVPEAKTRLWAALAKEIPAAADLLSADLVITPHRVCVEMVYLGRTPAGEAHRRTTRQRLSLDPTDAGAGEFIRAAYGATERAKAFQRLLPT